MKEGDCEIIIARAESCLDILINSVESGSITVGNLKLLEEHPGEFLKLVEAHRNDSKSIERCFTLRRSELKEFFTFRDHLKCFIKFSDIFSSGRPRIFKSYSANFFLV